MIRAYLTVRIGRWPSLPRGRGDLDRQLTVAAETLEELLVGNILPFWRPRAVDRTGGYHLHHDIEGNNLGRGPKTLIAQARTLWFFSRVSCSRWGDAADLTSARHGYGFLVERLWDGTHGGFYWGLGPEGEPSHPHKHALAQAYGIYALTCYGLASGDSEALDLATSTFTLYDHHAHDPVHGGYREMFRRDWSESGDLRGYWAADPELKLLDTHLHLLEAFSALQAVRPNPELAGRIRELIDILRTADAAQPGGVTAFRRDWTPLPRERVEYGFDMKRIWLMAEACRSAGLDHRSGLPLYRMLFEQAVCFGWDARDGGFFSAGRPLDRAHELVKPWWAQAEALVCSLGMWEMTGEECYAHVFLRTLDWVFRWQADRRHGDWYENVDHRRRPSGRKAWAWKTPYHNTRAVLHSLESLAAHREARQV